MSFMFASNITDHFGSKLLGDVLAHFSDLTPRLPEEHGKPGTKAEPQLSEWSGSNCIQSGRLRGPRCRKNFFRKYMVQAASRGADASGRCAPSPSPTMFSDVSGQSGSRAETPVSRADTPIRHRLPKAAQQFPALVASKLTTSSMKHTPVSHLASDHSNNKDAHGDDDDDWVHDHFKPRAVVAVEGVEHFVPFRHSAKPRLMGQPIRFESHVVHPATPASGSSSPPLVQPGSFSAPDPDARRSSKPNLNNLKPEKRKTVSSSFFLSVNSSKDAADDSDDEKKEGICNLALGSSKYDRMRRINAKRKVKENVVVIGDRDKVVTYEDLELANGSFDRYFRNKRPFDEARMISALSDFGVVGRTKSEKTVLFQILAEHVGKAKSEEVRPSRSLRMHAGVRVHACEACMAFKAFQACEAARHASPRTRGTKSEAHTWKRSEGVRHACEEFKDFCTIIEEARLRVRACRFSNIFSAWRQIDTDDIGALSVPKVVELLKLLGLGPGNGELLSVEARILDLHKDAADLYPLAEVEYVCQQLRENVESRRREAERDVQEKYHLSGPTFNEFRSQILELYETFNKLFEGRSHSEHGSPMNASNEDNGGKLGLKEVVHMLSEFGIVTGLHGLEAKDRLERQLHTFLAKLHGVDENNSGEADMGVNRGGGSTGSKDRAGGSKDRAKAEQVEAKTEQVEAKAGHAKYKCPSCMQQAPDLKSAEMHWDSKHSKVGAFDITKWENAQAEAGGVTIAGEAVRGGVPGEINFQWFLQFVKMLRRESMDSSMESVTALFQAYDKNRSGELEFKDVCCIIQELGMQPRTQEEQEAIGELLEDVDEDGSGTLHLEELLNMCVRIAERRAQFQRNAENAKAESLNLSRHQKYELRRAFDTLDADNSGELNLTEVVTAVHKYMAQWNLPLYQIKQIFLEVDEDGNGSVDFIEFMELMARIDAEVKLLEDEDNNKKEKKLQQEVKEVEAKADDGDQGTPGSNDRSLAKTRRGAKHAARRTSVHPSSEQKKQLEKR